MVDRSIVTIESFNFPNEAKLIHAGNLATIQDQAVAAHYLEKWQLHQDHEVLGVGRGMACEQESQKAPRGDERHYKSEALAL